MESSFSSQISLLLYCLVKFTADLFLREVLRRLCGASADRLFSIGIGFRAPCIPAGGNIRVRICFCEGSAEALRIVCFLSGLVFGSVFLEMCSPWPIAPVNYLHVIFY